MDRDLSREIASVARDPFATTYLNLLQPRDDTLATRGGGKGLKIYDDIERDCHAYAVLHKRKMAVVGRPWDVQPADSSRAGKKAAELVARQLRNLNFDLLTYDLLDANLKGFAVGEVVWALAGSEIVAREVIARDQRRFVFDLERRPRLITVERMLDGEELPARKFVVYTFGAKDANPFGLGLGTRLFWPAYFKRKGIAFWLTFADKFGSPTALGKYPPGTTPDDQAKLLAALDSLANDAGVAIPEGLAIEFMEAKRAGSIDTYEKLVRYMDEEMSLAVLGEQLTTTPRATGMGSGLADIQNEVRLEIAAADSDLLSHALNATLVRWIVELNLPGAPLPTVYRQMDGAVDTKAQAERDKILFDMGFRPSLAYVLDTYGGEWTDAARAPAASPSINSPAPTSGFAEGPVGPADQAALDAMLEALPASALQAQARAMLQPVVDMLLAADSFDDALGRLADLFPLLDSRALETMLARGLFVAETWGRLSPTDA